MDSVECPCGARLHLIPIQEIKRIVLNGYHKNGHVKRPTNPYSDKDYERCLWCGSDFSEVIKKLKEVEKAL